jgi:hypothetical protein
MAGELRLDPEHSEKGAFAPFYIFFETLNFFNGPE